MSPHTHRPLACVLALACLLGAGSKDKTKPVKESAPAHQERLSRRDKLGADILKEAQALLKWAGEHKLASQGRTLAGEISALPLPPAARTALEAAAAKLQEAAEAEDPKEKLAWDAKLAAARKKLAGLESEYGRWCAGEGFPVEGASWLMAAAALKDLEKAADDAAAAGDVLEAGRCLDALIPLAPTAQQEKLKAKLAKFTGLEEARKARDAAIEEAKSGSCSRKATRHGIHYAFALPDGYDPSKRWPVAITVTGSAGIWEDEMSPWLSHRGAGYILVSLAAVSNTNVQNGKFMTMKPLPYDDAFHAKYAADKTAQLRWESDGIQAVVEDLLRDCNADPCRVFLTGLSGGGSLAYYSIFHRRANFAGIAPRNPNYFPQGLDLASAPKPKGPEPFPVHIFEAGNDEYGNDCPAQNPGVKKQTAAALAELKQRQFTNVKHTVVPDVGHNESAKYYDQILAWYDEIQGKPKPAP